MHMYSFNTLNVNILTRTKRELEKKKIYVCKYALYAYKIIHP